MKIWHRSGELNEERSALLTDSFVATSGPLEVERRTATKDTLECPSCLNRRGGKFCNYCVGVERNERIVMGELSSWKFNIRSLGVILFILAACFCLYKIVNLWDESDNDDDFYYKTELKLVNAFCRHGDRSPSENLPPGDKHSEKIDFFWPNGMTNLTEGGKLRQYRLGYALRRRYSALFGDSLTSSAQLLAFSSSVQRCVDSAGETLRGFFNLDQSKVAALRWLQDYNVGCFSSSSREHCSGRKLAIGSGSPKEWRKVAVDVRGVPTLNWEYLYNCPWRQGPGKSPLDSDLLASKTIGNLSGIVQLKEQLARSYNLSFNYDSTLHWSTILTELRLEHTDETLAYTDHFAHWITKNVELDKGSRLAREHKRDWAKFQQKLPTLFDVYEVLNVYVARERIPEGRASQIQLGPMLSSLVDSQLVALNRSVSKSSESLLVNKELARSYGQKKILFYFTHDTVLQVLMNRLHMIEEEKKASYAERFVSQNDHQASKQFLAGLRMAEFGTTLLFELYETRQFRKRQPTSSAASQNETYAFVQAALYFQEDPLLAPIQFDYLHLGSICRHLFRRKFPLISAEEMDRLFYDKQFTQRKEFSHKLSCPFGLFRNVTMQDYAISPAHLSDLCSADK